MLDTIPISTESPIRMSARFGSSFFDRFSLELATSEALRAESYRLRHRIYVRELQYERAEDFPHGLEFDAWDRRALTVLLRHRASNRFIGCVRLITADPDDPTQPFPFEATARAHLPQDARGVGQVPAQVPAQISDIAGLNPAPRKHIGEVSRLAIVREFRRRCNDDDPDLIPYTDWTGAGPDRRSSDRVPPALGLIFSATWLGIEIGLEAVFVIMELRLARLLRSLGLHFTQITEPVQFRGLRAAFEIRREALMGELAPPLRDILDLVRSRVLALAPEKAVPAPALAGC